MIRRTHSTRRSGFSLIEVLVGLGILTSGLLAILAVFPYTLRSQRESELLTVAAGLAQLKAEAVRRDNDRDGRLLREIAALDTPTAPILFPDEPRLAYSFCGRSLQYANAPAGDPRGSAGVARVIVRYAASFRPSQDVIYELRFN